MKIFGAKSPKKVLQLKSATTVQLFGLIVGLAVFLPMSRSIADQAQLVSLVDPVVMAPAGGDGDSISPVITPDGRFVVFSSSANDLTGGGDDYFSLNVFLRDRANGMTALVSKNFLGSGGNGVSSSASVSSNGQLVVFQSDATDIASNDTNGVCDVFLNDLLNGVIYPISIATNGGLGNDVSSDPVMTPDGRYVAFISAANNLVVGDTNQIPDVFVRDVVNGTTVRVSIGAAPQSGTTTALMATPAITPDGRFVAFFSTARGLAGSVAGTSRGEIYVRDLMNSKTIWVSTNATHLVQTAIPFSIVPVPSHPVISDDGLYVAFKSGWTNGIINPPTGTRAASVVMQFDSVAGTNTIVSTNGLAPSIWSDDTTGPVMTSDGRFVAFATCEISSPGPTNFCVRVWDRLTRSNVLISTDKNGAMAPNNSESPVITPDGRYVAFLSNATNLVSLTVSKFFHLYLRDLQSSITSLVDADTNGTGSAYDYTFPSVSADARYIAFDGMDGQLVPLDNNKASDVFVRDTVKGATELISQRGAEVANFAGNGFSSSSSSSMSDDGRWVAFSSAADNLVENDTNRCPDVFVHDCLTGTNIIVSIGADGILMPGTSLSAPVISHNGQFVAFVSRATNLVAGKTNFFQNIFLRDLSAATTTMVSVNEYGTGGGKGDAFAPALSDDGRYVAFFSKATDLTADLSGTNTVLRDLNTGTTYILTAPTPASMIRPSISPDGHYVAYTAFVAGSQCMLVWDTQLATNVYTNSLAVSAFAICPTGTKILYCVTNAIVVTDFLANSNLVSIPTGVSKNLLRDSRPWSANGRYFACVTDTNAVAGDNNGTNDIYLYDLQTSAFTLVSVNSSHTGSGNDRSDSPVISGDGRFVAYRSYATNLIVGSTSFPNIFLFDQTTGSNTLLSTGLSAWSSAYTSSRPAINTDGSVVVFQSLNTGLNRHDLNRSMDIFSAALDSDGDGIPDFWMQYYFGHPNGQAGDLSRPADDADGDGSSNLQEYLAGTDPTNSASHFQLAIAPGAMPANSASLAWPATPGKNYRVQYKNSLDDAMWQDAGGQVSFAGNHAYFIEPANQPNRFYRVINGD